MTTVRGPRGALGLWRSPADAQRPHPSSLILLAGIVVKQRIVLVHRIEDHLRAGLSGRRGGPPAGAERYRPILMTTLATVAACSRWRSSARGGRAAALLALAVIAA